jgi:hypothetical protein
MAQRLLSSGSITRHSGRKIKHEAPNVLQLGAMRLAGKAISNFNRSYRDDYDYIEGDEDRSDNEDKDEGTNEVDQFFTPDHIDGE